MSQVPSVGALMQTCFASLVRWIPATAAFVGAGKRRDDTRRVVEPTTQITPFSRNSATAGLL